MFFKKGHQLLFLQNGVQEHERGFSGVCAANLTSVCLAVIVSFCCFFFFHILKHSNNNSKILSFFLFSGYSCVVLNSRDFSLTVIESCASWFHFAHYFCQPYQCRVKGKLLRHDDRKNLTGSHSPINGSCR